MSCINTFAYDLSAYLANTFSPLTGNSGFTVTNSAHFVSTISSETIIDNEIVVYKPRIWKRCVDDTFTILDRGNVDSFLEHLNNQEPSIRFTMETENDYKLAFLDKTYPNNFTAAYSNKAYAPFASRILH